MELYEGGDVGIPNLSFLRVARKNGHLSFPRRWESSTQPFHARPNWMPALHRRVAEATYAGMTNLLRAQIVLRAHPHLVLTQKRGFWMFRVSRCERIDRA